MCRHSGSHLCNSNLEGTMLVHSCCNNVEQIILKHGDRSENLLFFDLAIVTVVDLQVAGFAPWLDPFEVCPHTGLQGPTVG